jgi:transposase
MNPAAELPHDIEALKLLVLEHRQKLVERDERIRRLEHDNQVLFKMAFGRSTERRTPNPPDNPLQENLFVQEIAAEAARLAKEHGVDVSVEVPRERKKGKKGRRKTFPDHLPVIRTICDLPPDQRQCGCGGELREFSEEVSRELERIETTIVHEIVRRKYACGQCNENVVTAPWRGKVIERGLLGPGFLAHVITERFGNHLPYYRLEGKYKSEGLDLSRSVLCESMARCGELLEPIAEALRREVMESPVIHTDDTPVVIAKSRNGGPQKGRVWVYRSPKDRIWYDFTDSRKRDGPARVFSDYQGYIQADAYAGYDQLYLPGGAIEVGCWAHVRRKFVDAEVTDSELSKEAVDRIRTLFLIEQEAESLSPEARHVLRQEKSKPLVEAFEAWMNEAETKVLPKGPLSKGIGYAKNQWTALTRYLEDGRLSISNNAAERALRPFAIGRKNWLFFERETGGRTASILMSLLMTAKEAGIDPRDYFKDVLLRISTCSDVKSLTPHGWKERWEPEVKASRFEVLEKLSGKA